MSGYLYGLKPGLSYNIAITSAAAVASTNPVTLGVRVLRVVSTVGAQFVVGPGAPVATVPATIFMPANAVEYVQCSGSGTDKVSAIANSASGTFNITEMTQ